jgi:vacuolar-type H+-ATPase subunit I/STV1
MSSNSTNLKRDKASTLKFDIQKSSIMVVALLSGLMLLTRGAHFSGINALPEASWMIFMVAGTLLPMWSFAWFMGLAIGIDAYAFTFGGVPGTCLSIAYAMLIPAYASMWAAGRLVKPYFNGSFVSQGSFFGAALIGTAVCELISSGSFYLWSGLFEPTWAEFVAREIQYAPAAFASSAFWAVAFIAGAMVYRAFASEKPLNTAHY